MKAKRWLCALLSVAFAVVGVAALAACDDEETTTQPPVITDPTDVVAGPEAGVYYYDTGREEYLITLSAGNYFAFSVMGENKSGTYILEGSSLTLSFMSKDTLSASYADNVITLTYGNAQMRFLKKITYTVSYDSHGGSEVPADAVVNGKTLARPADPTRSDYKFVGWYEDEAHTTPFRFGTKPVTSNMTLHAYWAPNTGATEYTVKLDAQGGTLDTTSMTTVSGMLFDVPTPVRSGYTFRGWWVSAYEEADKLSYAYTEGTVFSENTTMYALWSKANTSKLAEPMVSVGATAITWDAQPGAIRYEIEVSKPSGGFLTVTGQTGSTTYPMNFATFAEGEYIVKVTAVASNPANNSEAAVRYFLNKGLSRVSLFDVVNNTLLFNQVPNAENYYITILCGNEEHTAEHTHEMLPLNKSTSYDFSACDMRQGGIEFTVTATAKGYASSTSKTFIYEQILDAIDANSFYLDSETETLYWNSVRFATEYIISISCGNPEHNHEFINNGSLTSYSLKECTAAQDGIIVNVYPRTKGYNSPAPSTYIYNKTKLPTPGSNVRIIGTTLYWDAVEGATEYDIRIGSLTLTATTNSYDFAGVQLSMDTDYVINLRARGAQGASSSWSDGIDVRYFSLYNSLEYSASVVSWRHVIGALYYQVSVNNGAPIEVRDGANFSEITLTKAGNNTISVRYFDSDTRTFSPTVTITVYAYTIQFDARGGGELDRLYKALGDKLELPKGERDGYTFSGWYNAPGGPQGNATRYDNGYFNNVGDIVLYAYWKAEHYEIIFNYGDYADIPGNDVEKGESIFGEGFSWRVPNSGASYIAFVGWFSMPNGGGDQFTDDLGNSLNDWSRYEGATVYAYFTDGLEYLENADGTYAVTKGSGINLLKHIHIEPTYNGQPVTVVEAYAFRSCASLISIEIPDTILLIEVETAFYGCTGLQEIIIYAAGTPGHETYYQSTDGVLLTTRENVVELAYYPAARTGAYTIPQGVERIPIRLFAQSRIEKITIPTSVTWIGGNAFYMCSQLTTVEFVMGGTDELTIEANAFANCSGLTQITLPARTAEFDDSASSSNGVFRNCTNLVRIAVEDQGAANVFYTSVGNYLADKEGYILFAPAGVRGDIVLPTQARGVMDSAFYGNTKITSLVIPGNYTYIGSYAFYGNTALTQVVFEAAFSTNYSLEISGYAFYNDGKLTTVIFDAKSNVWKIGDHAFMNTGLTGTFVLSPDENGEYELPETTGTLNLPETLTQIGSQAFRSLTKINTVIIPASVELIDTEAFALMSNLETLTFVDAKLAEEGEEQEGWLVINGNAFQNATKLTKVRLPVQTLTVTASVFTGCTNISTVLVPTENGYYADQDGVLYNKDITEVVWYPYGRIGDYVLPETVTSIGASAFTGNPGLTKITIGYKVTSIAASAFKDCTNLREVIFEETPETDDDGEPVEPVSLTFGTSIFSGCLALEEVTLPARVTEIPASMFAFTTSTRNNSLRTVNLPDTITKIGNYAFQYSNITSINLPDGLTSIGANAFDSTMLEEVTIPGSMTGTTSTDWGNYTFQNCTNLRTVTVEEGVQALPAYIFQKSGLQEISLPSTLKQFVTGTPSATSAPSAYTFYQCPNLTTVTIANENEEGVQGPDLNLCQSSMFSECTSLERLTIPKRVFNVFATNPTTMAPTSTTNAFSMCTNFVAFDVEEGHESFVDINGVLYGIDEDGVITDLVCVPFGYQGTIEIPATVDTIWYGCANNRDGLTGVTFAAAKDGETEASELTINGYAFWGCDLLEGTVNIPSRLTSLGGYAFYNCVKLEEVHFEENSNALIINSYTFYGCTSLTTVQLENLTGLTQIQSQAFYNCTGLQSITIPASVTTQGTGTNDTAIGNSAFYGCTMLATVTFADDGTNKPLSFGTYVFYNNTSLTSIKLPGRLKDRTAYSTTAAQMAVQTNVFQNDTNLATIDLSELTAQESVAIGNYAFAGTAITSLTIPTGIWYLGTYTFQNSTALTSVSFDERDVVMRNSTVATRLSFPSSNAQTFAGSTLLESVELPWFLDLPSVGYGASMFSGCTSLTTVSFPTNEEIDQVASVNASAKLLKAIANNMFQNCTALESISMPDCFTAIGGSAFSGCSALGEFVMPLNVSEGITGMGTYNSTFAGCTSLVSFTISKSIGTLGFSSNFSGCTSLREFKTPEGGSTNYDVKDGVLYSKNYKQLVFWPYAKTAEDGAYTIDENATSIGDYAFQNSGLETINIPASLTAIGQYAFDGSSVATVKFTGESTLSTIGDYAFRNTPLTAIEIAGSITSIGTQAFKDCSELATVTFKTGTAETFTIGTNAFENCTSLERVDLPSHLTSIGNNAFLSCTGLEAATFAGTRLTSIGTNAFQYTAISSISIPSGVTTVGNYAFSHCEALRNVTIPASVQTIGTNAFEYTTSLQTVTFTDPNNATGLTIGNFAFQYTGIQNIDLADRISSLGTNVFLHAESLRSIRIPNGVTSLGINSFDYCYALTSVSLPGSLTNIGNTAFRYCTSLTSVEYRSAPSTLTIGSYVFQYDEALVNFTLPSTLTSIGMYAFTGCALTEITIPATVTTLSSYAFQDNHNLTKVTFADGFAMTHFGSQVFMNCDALTNITLPDSIQYLDSSLFQNCTSLTSITLPDGLQYLGSSSLRNTGLTSITLPGAMKDSSTSSFAIGTYALADNPYLSSVTFAATNEINGVPQTIGIDDYAFLNCTALMSMTLPGYIRAIDQYAFDGCSNLTTLDLSVGLQSIGNYAFRGCTSLQSLYIPNTVTSLGTKPFGDVLHVELQAGNTSYYLDENGVLYGGAMETLISYPNNIVGPFEVPETVTSIAANAFDGAQITAITLPDTVSSIGNNAFANCTMLETFEVPAAVTSFNRAWFSGCTSLASYTVHENSATYKAVNGIIYSLDGATLVAAPVGLTGAVTIPAGVTSISANAFQYCSQVTSVTFEDTESNVTLGNYAFQYMSALESIDLPSGLTVISSSSFGYTTSLKSIDLPASLTTINSGAFTYSGLESIVIPANVTLVDYDVFAYCTSLRSFETEENSQLNKLGLRLFDYDTALETVKLPASLVTIESQCFRGCTGLTSLTFEEGSQLTTINNQAFQDCTALTRIVIPATVKTLNAAAFQGWTAQQYICFTMAQEDCTLNTNFTSCEATIVWNYVG